MANIAIPRQPSSHLPIRPLQLGSQRPHPRPDLSLQIVHPVKNPLQTPLVTPVSVITPPLTPQTSFESKTPPATPDGEAFPTFLRAFYCYHAEGPVNSDDAQSSVTLPLGEGDMILVHSVQPNGWADGTLLKCGARGWLPTNYCESYDDEMMRNLLRALTNVWDFLRGHEESDLNAFRSQDYVRGMIAGVRTLLERSSCLTRDSEPVASQPGIRSLRKALLAELSAFAKKAKAVQEACAERSALVERDWLHGVLDEILLKAMKVVTRAVRFLDLWKRLWQVKHGAARGEKSLPLASAPEPCPTASSGAPAAVAAAVTAAASEFPAASTAAPTDSTALLPATLLTHQGQTAVARIPQPHAQACTPAAPTYMYENATPAFGGIASPGRSQSDVDDPTCVQQTTSTTTFVHGSVDHPSPVSVGDSTSQSSSFSSDGHAAAAAADACHLPAAPHSLHLASLTRPDAEPPRCSFKHSSTAAAKRASASHRLSHTVTTSPTSPTSNHVLLASDRLCTTHEVFLGFIGAFIGLHLESRCTMELLVTTQQSVLACQALLDVVQEIWERDFRRSDAVDASRMAMHARLAELVNATKDIFQATDVAGDDDVFCLPDQSKRLVDAATACVRSAGDCVTKSRVVIERRGDFELEPTERASSLQDTSPLSPHSKPPMSRLNRSTVKSTATLPGPQNEKETQETDTEKRSSSEKPLPATPPHKRRGRPPVPNPPSRPPPDRPVFQRSTSAQSEQTMNTLTSLRPRGSSLVRTTTITKKLSETGLRRAGTRAVRATGSTSNLPTLVTATSTDSSPIDNGSASSLHPRNAASASSLPTLEDHLPSRPRTAHAGSVSNMYPPNPPSSSHLRIDAVQANRHPTLDVDIPRTSFFDMSSTPTNSSPEDFLKVEKSPLPLSLQNTPETAMLPPADATRFERINSGGDSIADSIETKSNSARQSGGSIASHASTRATTPDHAARKTSSDESIQESVSSVEEDATKSSESQLLAETYAHELTFNADGQITGGSLSALVERMTSHDSTPDALFVNSFYLTFRLFTTPMELAQTLIDRFERAGEDPEHGAPVRLRVYNVFKSWMEAYWNLEADGEALKLIIGFANGRLRFDLPSASRRLLELSIQVSDMQSQPGSPESPKLGQGAFARPRALSGANPSPEAMAPAPNVSKGQLNALKTLRNGVSACNLLDLDAQELARQFTIMQSKVFCAIQPEELLALEWTKKVDSKAVNVKAMIALSTDLANLVADTILSLELKKRAVMIKHWVKIASRCLELSNYDALMAIISSLNSSILLRLKKTWDLVSPKTLGKLDYLKSVVEVSRNYFVLRQRLQGHIAPCLPFMGIYLTDLTFIDCGNQSTRQHPSGGANRPIINFGKYVKTTRVIGDLQRFQVPYKLTAVPEMQDWMESQISRVRNAEQGNVQNYYRRSLMIEPREGSNPPPPTKHASPDGTVNSLGSHPSNASKFEFWSGLGLSLNKDKVPN